MNKKKQFDTTNCDDKSLVVNSFKDISTLKFSIKDISTLKYNRYKQTLQAKFSIYFQVRAACNGM